MPRSIPLRPAPLALSLSLLASFSAPALAADPVEQQMVVIGSRAPTSISELPGTVWVIEREQLDQQTQAGVPLTVCVDKVAASGGYMMACIGDRILSAPFAILGSIGVVAQLPNVHRLLKKHDIDFEVLTAGEYKRTLTVFGENTEKGREKFQEDLEVTHELFKNFVAHYRPQLNMDEIATGEVWLGQAALGKLLVDELKTSDEYLAEQARERDVYQVQFVERKSLQERVGLAASVVIDRVLVTWWGRLNQQKFWQ
ncbi:hypothetical protein ALP65_02120 [Pseudomonas aeruginosa]|uniref:Peptidase S49 domain-containing protein n=1 Tax=Pseudomonas aeruginosa TaxID=287 RepID=A0A3M5E6Q1_PSEAI|nr:hypothetical protein ALP65_02120 [Pseudomonas aeruginosa]